MIPVEDKAKPFTVTVPAEMFAKAERVRKELGMTRSELVRAALRDYLRDR